MLQKYYYHFEKFDEIGNDYKNWLKKAEELMIAASFLKDAYEDSLIEIQNHQNISISVPDGQYCLNSWYMLWGFAIENYLKAVLLKTGQKLVKEGKYSGKECGIIKNRDNHNLTKLAKLSSIYDSLSDEEKDLLDRLSFSIVAIGRYPIPSKAEDFKRDVKIEALKNFSGVQPIFYTTFNDPVILEDIIYKIKEFFK